MNCVDCEIKKDMGWSTKCDRCWTDDRKKEIRVVTDEVRKQLDRKQLDGSKDTNPKDAIGVTKLPLSLVPQSAIALASLAHLNGALKYGKFNWRAAGVRASVYLDAARRHLAKWENGEEIDEESVPHLASAMACLNILVDAGACGKLNDDRPPSFDVSKFFDELTPTVKHLQGLHAGKTPRHYTIADTEKPAECPNCGEGACHLYASCVEKKQ